MIKRKRPSAVEPSFKMSDEGEAPSNWIIVVFFVLGVLYTIGVVYLWRI